QVIANNRIVWTIALLSGLLSAPIWGSVQAQEQSAAVSSPGDAKASSTPSSGVPPYRTTDDHYRIGPGDVLDIRVFNKPQFNREGVKVDPRGMIRIPLVKQEIRAACRTEEELAAEVTSLLKEYLRAPEVIVQIKEYQSEPVAVLGSVRAPSRFQLQRRVRLLELITFVNGPTENAGRTVQVVHMGPLASCEASASANGNPDSIASQIDYYPLSDTLRGEGKSNPYVRAGDVISIAKADEVYVIGNVVRPTSIALNEPLTVSRAIAMAGGTAVDTKKTEIHIVRQIPGTTDKKEILVDLNAINRHKAEDVVLMANDIVDVPASGGKRLLRSLIGAVVPSVGNLPVRVIP
ncbi:MAG TPA: polysaccharide biosynthesis/export family protein, partial [Pyrinomonadaceae bacterium]|nr:polysaccharide biosynthesis/export family protein [Pyrinomonadaceae bacterium]